MCSLARQLKECFGPNCELISMAGHCARRLAVGAIFPSTCSLDCAVEYVPGLYARCRAKLQANMAERVG